MTASRASTVVVELTPPGRAAVAVVIIAGPNAVDIVRRSFAPATPWSENGPLIGRIMFGRWGGAHGEDLVVCRRSVDKLEIHCHGGAATAAIVEQMMELGCEKLGWQASGNCESRRDSTMGAAVAALREATTARTAGVLLDQYHGALSAAIEAARAALESLGLERARQIVANILAFRELGLHLTTPWRVVIAGPPNVGKSSLINSIAGYQRAIVSPVPGTTRDVVTVTTAINGWPVQIADTAGLRETRDELESAGVALAGAALEQAELVIAVSDASADVDAAGEVLSRVASTARVIKVVNKVDLIDGGGAFDKLSRADASPRRFPSNPACSGAQFVSALTGEGIAELLIAIERYLVPVAPAEGAPIAFTCRQISGLESAQTALELSNTAAADAALASVLSTGDDEICRT